MLKNAKPQIAVFTVYGALLVGIPVAAAVETSVNKPDTVTVSTIDPLDKYKGATELTNVELADLLSLVGFEGKSLKLAWAIVMRESRGHPTSLNNNSSTGDHSYGLFQINMIGSLGETRREKFGITKNAELLDPVTNAKAAYYMSNHGKDFSSWGLGPNAYDGTPSEPAVTKWLADFPKA